MSLDNFIPTVWAGTMLRYLDNNLVFGQAGVVNRDYEGDIASMGDTVKINQVGPVTIGDYVKDTDITSPETLTSAQTALVIDQAKFFNFQVDDIDKAQQQPKVMETAMKRAGYGVANVVDAKIATVMSAGVAAANILSADTSMTAADAYEHLVELGVALDVANVPPEGRWAIVPPWYDGLFRKDTRFGYAALAAEQLKNGALGGLAGFTIMKSNNLVQPSAGATYDVLAGSDAACSFAMQVVEVRAYNPEKRFADAVKGLNIYGVKVVLPNALAKIVCTKP